MIFTIVSYGFSFLVLILGLIVVWHYMNAELDEISKKRLTLKEELEDVKRAKFTSLSNDYDKATTTSGIIDCIKYAEKDGYRKVIAKANAKIDEELMDKVVKRIKDVKKSTERANEDFTRSTATQMKNSAVRELLGKEANKYVNQVLAPINTLASVVQD